MSGHNTEEQMKRLAMLVDALGPSLADNLRDIAAQLDAGEFPAVPRTARFYVVLEQEHDKPQVIKRATPMGNAALAFKRAAQAALGAKEEFTLVRYEGPEGENT
jgi:hypothetical protein